MHNVQELERQWFRYKLKSYIPKIILFIVLITLSIFILLFIFNSDISPNTSTNISEVPETIMPIKEEQTEITISPVPTKLHQEMIPVKKKTPPQEQLILKPSLEFINSLQYMPEEPIQVSKPKQLEQKPVVAKKQELEVIEHKNIKPIIETNVKVKIEEPTPEIINEEKKPPPYFTINIQQEEADIQEVIRRFYNNKKPALSLFVAKRFYAIKKYSDAYNYALVTNELNSEIEESWLIAAKSLSKLGQKEKAINLLNDFIGDSKSIRAIMLLEQIKNDSL